MLHPFTALGGQCVGVTKRLTSAQRAEAAASIRQLLQEIAKNDFEGADVQRAYLEGVLRGLDTSTESTDCT